MNDDAEDYEEMEYDLDTPEGRLAKAYAAFDDLPYTPDRWKTLENKKSRHKDLHGLLLLAEIMESVDVDPWILSGADHDIIYINCDIEAFERLVTPAQLEELYHAGIYYSGEHDCLVMYA